MQRRPDISASYDPSSGRINLPSHPSCYVVSHEVAHLRQHEEQSPLFRLDTLMRRVPYVSRLVRLALEADAAMRARAAMRQCGKWNRAARAEALRGLAAYAWSLVGF